MKKGTLFIFAILCIHSIYSQTWNELREKADEYNNIGDKQKTIEFAEKAKLQAEKEFGTQSENYLISIINLGLYYFNFGSYQNAEPNFKESLNLVKTLLGTNDPAYAQNLNFLALIYRHLGQYSKAEPLYLEALNLRKTILGTSHPDYAQTLNNLAVLYKTTGNYAKAEPFCLEALEISRKTLGINSIMYVKSLSNIASIYQSMGNFEKAEKYYSEVLEIKARIYGKKSSEYAISLDNLAVLYGNIGNYRKAEPLWIEAISIEKGTIGTEHPAYAQTVNNLAWFYSVFGNYEKAFNLFLEVANIRKRILGVNNPDYAQSLNTLANFYKETGDYNKAESYFLEALNITKNVSGTINPTYATYLNELAALYCDMKNYLKSESLFIEVLSTKKSIYGPLHPDYATTLNNIANLYTEMGNYSKAEPLFIESMNIRKNVYGPNHPLYNNSLHNLAVLYYNMGNLQKAEPLIIQSIENLHNQVELNFSFLSEHEKEDFLSKKSNFYFDMYNSFLLERKKQNPSSADISYNNELIHKGMLLKNVTEMHNAINSSKDTAIIKIYDQLIALHNMLSQQYASPISERKLNTDSLERIANVFEKELLNKGKDLPGFENLTGLSKVKWQDVQKQLKPGEAAIEFVNFNYYKKKWTDSIFYCALLLRKEYTYPKMIYLFEENQLQNILANPKALNNENYINGLYSLKPDLKSNPLATKNTLYKIIWQPIDSLLSGINTIYMAPGGLLHKISFSAIPVSDSVCLSDRYNLNILSSTRVITQNNKNQLTLSKEYSSVLYGGIVYDVDSAEMVGNVKQYQSIPKFYTDRGSYIPENNRGSVWKYLPETLKEVNNIQKLFDSKQIPTTLFKDKQATEESFKHLADNGKSPDVIHIATHGFFFPEVKLKPREIGNVVFRNSSNKGGMDEPVFTYSQNPLLRSGLLFSGANRAWSNKPPIENVEDGTLTAYEISNMNLNNTKLVVLSACETGLGEVKGSEGVYGLQRALKMAGVKNIIMSLWEVPDKQTSELMKLFYNDWLGGMSLKKAFNNAQIEMRKKYSPFYWAAFVLVE